MTDSTTRKATIYDVAKDAGVSVASVSRVLDGRASVSADVQKRVKESIKRLQYVPNKVARNLARSQTDIIGLIVTKIENPFFGALAKAVESPAQEKGYTLILSNTDGDPKRERKALNEMAKEQVAGIIWVPSLDPANKPFATAMGVEIPIVTIDDQCEGCDSVRVDHLEGTRQIISHLQRLGHRHIAYAGGPTPKQGHFRSVMSASIDQETVSRYVFDHHDYNSWVDLCDAILHTDPRPTAVWAHNDQAAMRLYDAMEALAVSIPNDISVVGYDNTDLALALRPRLTSVAQSSTELGSQAFHVLKRRIDEKNMPLIHVSLQPQLIIRESTGPKAVEPWPK